MALTDAQKTSKLFKLSQGVSETSTARNFFEEPYGSNYPILSTKVWQQADLIPSTAPGGTDGQTTGVVTRYIDKILTVVAGAANAWHHADLEDTIPFNFGDGSYNYVIKDSTGASIPFGANDWLLDSVGGVLYFYGGNPSNMPPKISFYKYSGTKGVGGSVGPIAATDVSTNQTGETVQSELDILNAFALTCVTKITANTIYTVKATGGDFTTLQLALDHLNNIWIDPSIYVTIQIDAGVFVSTSTISIVHPQANRIKIIGNGGVALSTTTLTSFVSASGAIGNWDVILGVTDTTGISVGGFVQLAAPTGTGEFYSIAGIWEVTNVDTPNNQITIKHKYRQATFPTMTLTGGTVVIHTTILQCNGCDGFWFGSSLGLLGGLAIVGNGANGFDGINISQRQVIFASGTFWLSASEYLGIANFERNGINVAADVDFYTSSTAVSGCGGIGFQATQGAKLVVYDSVSSGNNDYGCSFSACNVQFINSYSTGNKYDGIRVQNNTTAVLTTSVVCGNSRRGLWVTYGASVNISGNFTSLNNLWDGVQVQVDSNIYCSGTLLSTNNGTSAGYYGVYAFNNSTIVVGTLNASSNPQGDIRAANQSIIKATTYTGTPVYSPAKDIVGNNQSVIKGTAAFTPTELDTTNFDGVLSAADTDVQKAFETLDNAGSITQTNQLYVDRVLGNDTTGTGDIAKPFATIQKALTTIGHATSLNDYLKKFVIHIAKDTHHASGGTEYTENLVVPNRIIDIVGPGVKINGTITRPCAENRLFGLGSSELRPTINWIGEGDARYTHSRLNSSITLFGNYRTTTNNETIATIQGTGSVVTVSVVPGVLPFKPVVGFWVKITGTTAYNASFKQITQVVDEWTFKYSGTGTGLETAGTITECDATGGTQTTKNTHFYRANIEGTFTEDDGTVNAAALTAGPSTVLAYYTRFASNVEGRVIGLYRIEDTEFSSTVTVGSFSGILDSNFYGAVWCNTFNSAKFLNVITALGIDWTVASANQTISTDLITTIYLDRYINWTTNRPRFYQLNPPYLNRSSTTLIYMGPTGSDATGDGSSGNPYFSPHRALKDLSGSMFVGSQIQLYWLPGTYDYSALGDLIIDNKVLINASNQGYSYFGANGGTAWTSIDSGTFSPQTDTSSNVHTDLTKSWTPDALVGKFLRCLSMNTGSLPGTGSTIEYPRYVPIIKNTATTIETAFYGSASQSQDVASYEIVEHAVVLDFGARNIHTVHTSFGVHYWFFLKIITTGDISYSETGSRFGGFLQQNVYPVHNNCNISCRLFSGACGEHSMSYVRHTGYSVLAKLSNSALESNLSSPPVNSRVTVRRWENSVARNTNANPVGALLYFGVGDLAQYINRVIGRSKFYHCEQAIFGESIELDARVYLDDIDFLFGTKTGGLTSNHKVFTTSNFTLVNEPTKGRISFDGTNASSEYVNFDKGINLRSLQPDTLPGHFDQTNIGGIANKATNKTGATSVIGTVVSQNNLTAITIYDDGASQLSLPSILGVKFTNSNANNSIEGMSDLYWTLVDSGGTRTFSLYKESAHTTLVAQGSRVGDGVLNFTEQNSSGISGSVTVAYTTDDSDVGNILRCPSESSIIATPVNTNTYIGVITEVVADGSQVFVARTGSALVLLEDGQSCVAGEFCIISSAVAGRTKSTPTSPSSMIGFFEESKVSGIDVLARVTLRLDNASSGTIYATSVATSTPATSVQDEIDKFNSKVSKDRISVGIKGTSITTGHKAWLTMGYDGEFTGWEVTADAAGSVEFDIGKTNYASFPTVAFIDGTESPQLVTVAKNQNLTIASWTKPFLKGDRIEVLIVSISGITEVNLTLYTKRF